MTAPRAPIAALVAALLAVLAGAALGADRDVANVAVIEADPTILQPGEPFDLQGKTVTFTPRTGGGYASSVAPLAMEPAGDVQSAFDDDEIRAMTLAFPFPFFGTTYTQVFVGANGFITLGGADTLHTSHFNLPCPDDPANPGAGCVTRFGDASTTLDLFADSLARVSVLWQDWNPVLGGRMLVRSVADRIVVTWQDIQLFGGSAPFTFQAALHANGTIALSYPTVGLTPPGGFLVGIAPENALGHRFLVTTLDLSAGTGGSVSSSPHVEPLAQAFGTVTVPYVHLPAVMRRFFVTHADRVDQAIVASTFDQAMGNAFAFELTLQQTVQGIGREGERLDLDESSFSGSRGVLQSLVNLGALRRYPASPHAAIPGLGANSVVSLIGQEAGHMWLATVKYFDGFTCRDDLLGRDLAHWSFFHDTDGSVVEGNEWLADGAGRFTSGAPVSRYSELDQYLMGLRPAPDVAPFFFIGGHSHVSCFTFHSTASDPKRSCAPESGVTVTGTRQNVTVQQVIDCADNGGARVPATGFSGVNPTTAWRQAFILVARPGADATADAQKLEAMRAAWTSFFPGATGGRASVATELDPRLAVTGSGDFGAVAPGASAQVTLTVTNTGGGTLAGTARLGASTPASFAIVSGAEFQLAAGASQPLVVRFTAPAHASTVGGAVDVTSSGGAASRPLTASVRLADLVVTSVVPATETPAPGARLAVTVAVRNQGSGAAASTLALYLSRTAARGPGAVPLGLTGRVGPIAAGATASRTMTVTIPRATAPADYVLLACVNDRRRIAETDVTNNCAASAGTLAVRGPDLLVDAVTTGATSVAVGGVLSVAVTVRNAGTLPASPSVTRLYLAAQPQRGAGDRLLGGTGKLAGLPAGRVVSTTIVATVIASTPPGTYHLLACADDASRVAERTEANNCRAAPTTVTVHR